MSGEEDEEPSRSDRLRERRSQRSKTSERDETSETSKPSKTSVTGESGGVKDERTGVYMYLTPEQKEEIEQLYKALRAKYEVEFGADFEKNRHFFPILIQNGLDGLDGLDAQDIQDRLDGL